MAPAFSGVKTWCHVKAISQGRIILLQRGMPKSCTLLVRLVAHAHKRHPQKQVLFRHSKPTCVADTRTNLSDRRRSSGCPRLSCSGPLQSKVVGATGLVFSSTVLFRSKSASCILNLLLLTLIHEILLCALTQATLQFLVLQFGLLQNLLELFNLFLYSIYQSKPLRYE